MVELRILWNVVDGAAGKFGADGITEFAHKF
jgi:hypothetical protein